MKKLIFASITFIIAATFSYAYASPSNSNVTKNDSRSTSANVINSSLSTSNSNLFQLIEGGINNNSENADIISLMPANISGDSKFTVMKNNALQAYKNKKIKEIKNIVSLNNYSDSNQSIINNKINSAIMSINEAISNSDVDNIYNNTENDLKQIKTISDEQNELKNEPIIEQVQTNSTEPEATKQSEQQVNKTKEKQPKETTNNKKKDNEKSNNETPIEDPIDAEPLDDSTDKEAIEEPVIEPKIEEKPFSTRLEVEFYDYKTRKKIEQVDFKVCKNGEFINNNWINDNGKYLNPENLLAGEYEFCFITGYISYNTFFNITEKDIDIKTIKMYIKKYS